MGTNSEKVSLTKLTFQSGETVQHGNLLIPIPDGYHYTTSSFEMYPGKKHALLIVPAQYAFNANPDDAPFSIAFEPCMNISKTGNGFDIRPETKAGVERFLVLKWGNVFRSDATWIDAGVRKGYGAFYQLFGDEEIPSHRFALCIIVTKSQLGAVHIHCNKKNADLWNDPYAFIDKCNSFLEKIKVSGESTLPLVSANPFDIFCSHYMQLKNQNENVAPGIQIVTNQDGTEYEFIPLSKMQEEDDTPDEEKALYQRIIDKDAGAYDLFDKVSEMQRLFHVNPAVFDEKHDRECEIEQGLLHRAYMMSALRSFAWTLTDYCETNSLKPDAVSLKKLKEIVSFCAEVEWLNYRGRSHCSGLCDCADLHVWYIPDKVSQSDRKKLLPSDELIRETEKRKAALPYYHPILDEVNSLDALRKDLDYIYPAVKALWDDLAAARDYDKALTGNEADIVYAWCSLAKSAKEPFYMEDGPSYCFFSQIKSSRNIPGQKAPQKVPDPPKKPAKKAESKGALVPLSDLTIKDGVVTEYKGTEKDIILPGGIRAIGEDAFAGNTDLRSIVIPEGVTRIGEKAFCDCPALEQVSLPDSLEAIEDSAFSRCTSLNMIRIPTGVRTIGWLAFYANWNLMDIFLPGSVKNIGYCAFDTYNHDTLVHTPEGSYADQYCKDQHLNADHITFDEYVPRDPRPVTEESTAEEFCVDGDELMYYTGRAKLVVVPDTVRKIHNDAFRNNLAIERIIIPADTQAIGRNAFTRCENLRSIVLNSATDTCPDFSGCISLESLCVPYGVKEIDKMTFALCRQLKDLYLPPTITSICSYPAIPHETLCHVAKGSYAEQYVKEKELHYDHQIDGVWKEYDEKLKQEKEQAERNEKAYQQLIENAGSAKTVEEWSSLASRFSRLNGYKDSQAQAKTCADTASELQRKIDEERRRALEIEEERRKEQERIGREQKRKALENEKKEQETIIQQNQGLGALFGEKAQKRKAAQKKLAEIERELIELGNMRD